MHYVRYNNRNGGVLNFYTVNYLRHNTGSGLV